LPVLGTQAKHWLHILSLAIVTQSNVNSQRT
jgi:hypothetical protein